MDLTGSEREDLQSILATIFGAHFQNAKVNERTLALTEEMLLEAAKCNTAIDSLLRSLPCAMVGRGFLRRCLRAVRNAIDQDAWEFRMCHVVAAAKYRSAIELSVRAR